jgi:DNA-directed RNA polymerase specialized sigma24 family protein
MVKDHDQRLAEAAERYVESRRALVQAVLVARADGYSYEEIARVTGLNEVTVRRLVRPAD